MSPIDSFPSKQDADSAETLMRVTPRDAQGYARSRGWVEAQMVGNLMVYGRPGMLDQVLVPTDSTRHDYAERVEDAVEKLAKFEERPFIEVLDDLLNFSSESENDPELTTPVKFSRGEVSIEDVYRQLRPTETPTVKLWIAYVEELKGSEGDAGAREGEVVFTLFDGEELLRAKASLNTEQYRIAYEAHNPTRPLVVSGQLSRASRAARLSNISEMRFAAEPS